MNTYLKFLIVTGIAGAVFYWRTVWGWFVGMSAIDALDLIVTFLLKVGALSVLSFLAYNLPHGLKPWARLLRRKQARAFRGRRLAGGSVDGNPDGSKRHPYRVNKDRLLLALVGELASRNQRGKGVGDE